MTKGKFEKKNKTKNPNRWISFPNFTLYTLLYGESIIEAYMLSVCDRPGDLRSLHHDNKKYRGSLLLAPGSYSVCNMLKRNGTERRHGWTEEVEKGGETPVFCFNSLVSIFFSIPHFENVNYRLLSRCESIKFKKKRVFIFPSSSRNVNNKKIISAATFLFINLKLTKKNYSIRKSFFDCWSDRNGWSLFPEEKRRGESTRVDIQIVKTKQQQQQFEK